MEMDHKKVYSKDMAFANSMTADEEVKEQELQRLQLEALLRVENDTIWQSQRVTFE